MEKGEEESNSDNTKEISQHISAPSTTRTFIELELLEGDRGGNERGRGEGSTQKSS